MTIIILILRCDARTHRPAVVVCEGVDADEALAAVPQVLGQGRERRRGAAQKGKGGGVQDHEGELQRGDDGGEDDGVELVAVYFCLGGGCMNISARGWILYT